jgi:AcrR family transcriptional regulator
MGKARLEQATVIQAAAELADTVGLEKVTLGDVAAQLGVRTPSLYNHVAGLAGLRRELTLLGLHELSRRLGQAVMGKAKNEALQALAWVYRDFVKEHPGLYTATVRAPDPEDAEQQAAAKESVDIVLKVLAPYGLHDDDALHAVRGIRSILHGFTTLEIAGGFGLPLELDESFRRLVGMFIEGLEHDRDRS